MKNINITKTIIYTLFLIPMVLFLSCEKYNAVYEYNEVENITVQGLNDYYSTISGIGVLDIDPIVTSNKSGDFEYLWGIYETNTQGYNPVLDTIARTKRLNYQVNRTAKNWYLLFRVTNTKTGYSQYFKSTVGVETPYTRGWYIAKDDGMNTDMDFFTTPTSIIPSEGKIENVYSLMNGKKLEGKALLMAFFIDYKAPFNNTFANTRSISLLSERDIAVMELSNLKTFRDFNTIFQSAPTNRNPGMICNDFLKYFLINDGQLYSLVGQGVSSGVFGGRKLQGSNDIPYHLSKYHTVPSINMAYFYDDLSSSFFSSTDRSLYLTKVTTSPGNISLANKRMIFMGTKANTSSGGAPQAVAILQDKTDADIKTLHQITPQGPNNMGLNSVGINTTDKLHKGTNFSLLNGDQSLIYFSVGNEIWSRNLMIQSAVGEQLQFQVPNGEEITFIRHRKLTGTGVESAYSYNYVMIGTKTGENYKIRFFTKNSLGNLDANPAFVLEGKGRAIDAMFIGPAVNANFTYPNTY